MRRLWALTSSLPAEAAVWRNGKLWTQAHELAATAVERADMWGHLLAQVLGAEPRTLPQTVVFTHPDREVKDDAAPEQSSGARRVSPAEFFGSIGR